jgi:hypothetical protein
MTWLPQLFLRVGWPPTSREHFATAAPATARPRRRRGMNRDVPTCRAVALDGEEPVGRDSADSPAPLGPDHYLASRLRRRRYSSSSISPRQNRSSRRRLALLSGGTLDGAVATDDRWMAITIAVAAPARTGTTRTSMTQAGRLRFRPSSATRGGIHIRCRLPTTFRPLSVCSSTTVTDMTPETVPAAVSVSEPWCRPAPRR